MQLGGGGALLLSALVCPGVRVHFSQTLSALSTSTWHNRTPTVGDHARSLKTANPDFAKMQFANTRFAKMQLGGGEALGIGVTLKRVLFNQPENIFSLCHYVAQQVVGEL